MQRVAKRIEAEIRQRWAGRIAVVLFGVGLIGFGLIFVAWTALRPGPTLVVTNGCGYAVFADNGQDGFEIADRETARCYKIGDGLMDLGRASGDRSLRITVGPPTTLQGSLCP